MHKSSRKSAKIFHEKDATLIAEKVCVLKPLVGGWWEEKVDLTPCNGATPKESRIREICTYGSMRGRRSKDLLLLYRLGLACKKNEINTSKSKLLFRHALITKTFYVLKKYILKGGEEVKFKIVIKEDLEDGGYNVSCPALSGCHSQGETIEEALENIKDAIQGCMEVINQRALKGIEEKTIEVVV